MPSVSLELGAILVFAAIQLITYGMLRQQVKNLEDSRDEEKLERKQLSERVRALELMEAGSAKKAGGSL